MWNVDHAQAAEPDRVRPPDLRPTSNAQIPESFAHHLRQPGASFPAPHIEQIVRRVFRWVVSLQSDGDTVVVERGQRDVSITYSSASASAATWDRTGIALRLHLDVGEMWIGSLRVAVRFREKGMGTQLVAAAEAIACAARIEVIHVFPLLGAKPFWIKNGYRDRDGTTRVLSKWASHVTKMAESGGQTS
jgi:GNAT superfamily N-acetyltransferase